VTRHPAHSFTRALVHGLLALFAAVLQPVIAAETFNPSPHAIEVPSWFRETFLDFREDTREAAKSGRRLMVYFGQDGCPYCRELMRVNFGQKDIADLARRHFDALAINIWGDREVTWTDGKVMSEKVLAALERRLRETYGAPGRDVGAPVHASELVAVAASVVGVVGVDLDLLHRGATATLAKRLVAAPASLAVPDPFGSELLALSPDPFPPLLEMP